MYASRSARQAQSAFRVVSRRAPVRSTTRQQLRFATSETTNSASSSTKSSFDSKALTGGLIGGGAVFLAGFAYYHYSGASSIVSAASQTKQKYHALTSKLQSQAPPPNEALQWLHNTALSYAAFIPGAKSYIDSAFKDLEKVQQKHGEEVENIVKQVYSDLKETTQDATKKSVTETATRTWEILAKGMRDIAGLAGDSFEDILNNHPQIREKLGGSVEQFKTVAKNAGGDEAKEEINDTMKQISDLVMSGGGAMSADGVSKIKNLIQEKSEKLKKMGEKAWSEGMEQAKPYLEKKPEVKKLVEGNEDVLKSGNVNETLKQISDAIYTGDIGKLNEYVQNAKEKAKNASKNSGMDGLFGGAAGGAAALKGTEYAKGFMPKDGPGAEVVLKIQELMKVAESRGGDAEKIMKSAWEDIKSVLEKRVGEMEKLKEEGKQEGKPKVDDEGESKGKGGMGGLFGKK